MMTIASSCFSTGSLSVALGSMATNSGTWYGANLPLAIPFQLDEAITIYQLGWGNGSAGDNADVGIYDSAWNLIISTGSTACVNNNVPQFVDVADTTIGAGSYFAVMARDTTTANRLIQVATTRGANVLLGMYDSGTAAFPLPNPLTNMVLCATAIATPRIYIALRALV
jgi:hypothetical protein